MTTEILPEDPALPQLRIAWDPAKMLEVFRRTLQPAGDRAVAIEDCRLRRVRYRPATRSIVLYELRLRSEGSGRVWSQWVTGTIYPGHRARRRYRRLLDRGAGREIPAHWRPFEPCALVADLEMLVQVFPLDRHLPNLSRLIAGPTPELEGALRESLGGDDWRISEVAVEPTRYRPFLGATLRYTVEALDPAGRRRVQPFYVKLYRDDGGADALATLAQLAEVSRQAGGRFEAAQPIGYFGELRALVLASVNGHSLEAVLIAETGVEPAVRKVARALAELHRAPAPPGRHRRKQGMLDRAVRAGSFIRWARPAEARRIDRLLDKLQSRLSDDAFAPTHLDLKSDHIFLDGDRVVLIDLDSFAPADPVFDPATLLARLEALPDLAPVSPQTARLAADTLVEEYFRAVPAGWRERLGANYACAALKVALYYLQHQEPEWPAKVAALLERAERRL